MSEIGDWIGVRQIRDFTHPAGPAFVVYNVRTQEIWREHFTRGAKREFPSRLEAFKGIDELREYLKQFPRLTAPMKRWRIQCTASKEFKDRNGNYRFCVCKPSIRSARTAEQAIENPCADCKGAGGNLIATEIT